MLVSVRGGGVEAGCAQHMAQCAGVQGRSAQRRSPRCAGRARRVEAGSAQHMEQGCRMQGRSAQRRRPRCAGRARRKRALGRTNLTKPVQPQVIDLCASDGEQEDPDKEPIVVADDGPSPGPFPRLAPPNHEVVVIADDYPSPLQAVAARTVQPKRLPSFASLSKSLPSPIPLISVPLKESLMSLVILLLY